MEFYAEITKSNIHNYLCEYEVILCKIRNSRIKAKKIAILEMIFLQTDSGALFIKNGPLGDIKGLVSFLCPKNNLGYFKDRLKFLGYFDIFYILDFNNLETKKNINLYSINPLVWKGKKFSIERFFSQNKKIYEEQSPHNRMFRIYDNNGEIKEVCGYRGDGSEFGSRALPVEDARCMVNLSQPGKNKKMIDPFAGAGGIIYQFKYIVPDGNMISVDIDPILKPGLEYYGAAHYIKNASGICLTANSFNSVITEVPFSVNALDDINNALRQLSSFISKDGVFIIMCGKNQSGEIQKTMEEINNYLLYKHE
ncbi:MAG: hypothetical protein LBI04_03495, partial [Treponema sp.]|nr:hypothetical protein [Treponema sp.]